MRFVALATGLMGMVLSGCGGPAELDLGAAEQRIATSLRDSYSVEVGRPNCGDDAPPAEGGTRFSCRVRVDDREVVVDVTVTGSDADLRVRPRVAVLTTAEIIDDLRHRLGERFDRDRVKVTCPGPAVRVLDPGDELTCEASGSGPDVTVIVRVRDPDGNLTYTVR